MAKQMFLGIASFIPGISQYCVAFTGATISARYCYAVWLRHLVLAKKSGLDPNPKQVAELGPGSSLGIGLAALISGCDRYYALDVVELANVERNLKVFDELVVLFQNRTPIPGEDEFPEVKPYLDEYNFPADILDENRLQHVLEESRIARIRESIINVQQKDSLIQYMTPWSDASVINHESIDLIFSQAVLEHVEDLSDAYEAMHSWLKPNGYMSHQIDFKCHGLATEWNGHWIYPDSMWYLIKGKRPYLLNREPHSKHIALLKDAGFRIQCDKVVKSRSNLKKSALAMRFKSMDDEDLVISGACIQAVKVT